jgi:hypothetical protein
VNEYTATNGVNVTVDVENLTFESDAYSHTTSLFGEHIDALREFFRAEEDERLGRWRWPENPDYVVYPESDGLHAVLRESAGETTHRNGLAVHDMEGQAARDYVTAHPDPKPAWHTTRDGDIWMLERTDRPGERAYLALEGRFFPVPPVKPSNAHWEPAPFASDFKGGYLFYREDKS